MLVRAEGAESVRAERAEPEPRVVGTSPLCPRPFETRMSRAAVDVVTRPSASGSQSRAVAEGAGSKATGRAADVSPLLPGRPTRNRGAVQVGTNRVVR
jgi:hypothetical protein